MSEMSEDWTCSRVYSLEHCQSLWVNKHCLCWSQMQLAAKPRPGQRGARKCCFNIEVFKAICLTSDVRLDVSCTAVANICMCFEIKLVYNSIQTHTTVLEFCVFYKPLQNGYKLSVSITNIIKIDNFKVHLFVFIEITFFYLILSNCFPCYMYTVKLIYEKSMVYYSERAPGWLLGQSSV